MDLTTDDILRAATRMKNVIHRTILQPSRTFSALAGGPILLKPECLQKTGSWKIRGAYTTLDRFDAADRERGVVTFSAGNWGQAVACAASMFGSRAVVVLPERANPKKVSATRGYGATVVIHGTDSEQLLL